MYLINISNSNWDLKKFKNSWEEVECFLEKHDLDGVELILHERENLDTMPSYLPKGLHMRYFPTWLEFYRDQKEKVEQMFEDKESIRNYYGGLTPESLVDVFKQEYKRARELGVKYMVFHVAHVTNEHAFTYDFDYDDDDVLDASIDLINKVFDEDSEIELLFENLWWPGLRLTDAKRTKDFMERINYKNKGIMLDLSHLMITNPEIENLKQAGDYILQTVGNLGEAMDYIRGIHVNKAIPKDYMTKNHCGKYEKYEAMEEGLEKYLYIMEHIKKMDWHVPYDDENVRRIAAIVNPKYIVYELIAQDLDQLEYFVKTQNRAFGR